MLSKKVLSIFLFILGIADLINADVTCDGQHVSLTHPFDLQNYPDRGCTIINGDITISDIQEAILNKIFPRINVLNGCLRIKNTVNVTIWFDNLKEINSGGESAMVIENNQNLDLQFGPKMRKVHSLSDVTFRMIGNGKKSPIGVSDYNTLYLAANIQSKSPKFQIDFSIQPDSCSEDLFKTLGIIMGFLAVTLATGLIIVAIYGRDITSLDAWPLK